MPKENGSSIDESKCFQDKIMLLRRTTISSGFGITVGRRVIIFFFHVFYSGMDFTLPYIVLVRRRILQLLP